MESSTSFLDLIKPLLLRGLLEMDKGRECSQDYKYSSADENITASPGQSIDVSLLPQLPLLRRNYYEEGTPDQLSFGARRSSAIHESNYNYDPLVREGATSRRYPGSSATTPDAMATEAMFEPLPIDDRRPLHVVQRIDRLPLNILQASEDYIALLSDLYPNVSPSDKKSMDDGDDQQAKKFTNSTSPESSCSSSRSTSTATTSSDQGHGEDANHFNQQQSKYHEMHQPVIQEDDTLPPSPKRRKAQGLRNQYQIDKWQERYEDLVAFQQSHGHCNVPHHYTENIVLGRWVKRQRHQFKLRQQGNHSHITQERIDTLEALGFTWDTRDEVWETSFQMLEEFRKQHSHCKVPSRGGYEKLSAWIKRQRRQYRLFISNQPSVMTPERVQRLEDLGLVFNYYADKHKAPGSDLEMEDSGEFSD